jgi:hypothetical protein
MTGVASRAGSARWDKCALYEQQFYRRTLRI